MPKQRQTCTRCSQRRQKCDRQSPCSRCVQNGEAALCTTIWVDRPIRKYPRKSTSPSVSWQSAETPSETATAPSSLDVPSAVPVSQAGMIQVMPEVNGHVHPPVAAPSQSTTPPAWPAAKLPVTIEALLSDKDQPAAQNLQQQIFSPPESKDIFKDIPTSYSYLAPAAKAIQMQFIQSLLPPKTKLLCVVDYYEKSRLLYWSGGVYHAPSFRSRLHAAYQSSNTFELQGLDWRWNALLFAILSSSMIGSPEAVSTTWGFTINDKARLARDWGAAAVSCLNLGNYTTQYHIHSIQAIYVLHAYEHLLGSAAEWAALRSIAFLIARGLGLNKLAPHPDDDRILELNPEQKQAFVEREIGRRTWYFLAIQDWLCATSQPNYATSISKRFTCARPKLLDDETMTPVSEDIPTFTIVGLYIFDIASLLLDFHDAMKDAEDEDDEKRYSIVLKYDGEMRAAWIDKSPKCLSPQSPGALNQPRWVHWAWKMHQSSANHKTIVIHQSFLTKSLKNARYTYSKWACATAAKNIINIYSTRDTEDPQWWIEQAFLVTAGACLMLDLLHRTEKDDSEARDHVSYIQKAISLLQNYYTSSVALHGVKLLQQLLQEFNKVLEGPNSNTRQPVDSAKTCCPVLNSMTAALENGKATRPWTLISDPGVLMSADEAAQFNFDIDDLGYEDLIDYLPMEGGLDPSTLYADNMYAASLPTW